ncbi:hypothetical protein GQ53DRAFT_120599 [Thozetella sp. PMI_491]|nr:hypothetical protein GQ53DRAFT_120599 [Thozetella sp. PMI_491]
MSTDDMADLSLTGWVTEPNGRGTFGILKSCTITLSLCVYSALRLNVPRAGSTPARKFLIKTIWVLIGMFAPELVVFFAWDQGQQARWLTRELESIFSQQVKTLASSKTYGRSSTYLKLSTLLPGKCRSPSQALIQVDTHPQPSLSSTPSWPQYLLHL